VDAPKDTNLRFEYPLNERTRLLLRLDYLHSDFQQLLQNADAASYRAAMQRASDMVALTSRGDLKSELLKELGRIKSVLLKYQKRQMIDAKKLEGLLQEIEVFVLALIESGKPFLTGVRANEFIISLFNRFNMPGGSYSFDLPEFYYYLEMQDECRHLFSWIESELQRVHRPIRFILALLRDSLHEEKRISQGLSFSTEFKKNQVPNLLCIAVSKSESRYPEIMAGGNRVNIRFVSKSGFSENKDGDEVKFKLAQSIC